MRLPLSISYSVCRSKKEFGIIILWSVRVTPDGFFCPCGSGECGAVSDDEGDMSGNDGCCRSERGLRWRGAVGDVKRE